MDAVHLRLPAWPRYLSVYYIYGCLVFDTQKLVQTKTNGVMLWANAYTVKISVQAEGVDFAPQTVKAIDISVST